MRRGPPVEARISIDGALATTFTHADGEGWKKTVLGTTPHIGEVAVEVSASSAHKRRFCWDATTHRSMPERAP